MPQKMKSVLCARKLEQFDLDELRVGYQFANDLYFMRMYWWTARQATSTFHEFMARPP